jgi:hypothetical protein
VRQSAAARVTGVLAVRARCTECGAKGLPEALYGMQGGAALHSEKSKTKQEVHGHNARTHADASKREVQRQLIDMYKIHVQKLLHQDIGNHDQHTKAVTKNWFSANASIFRESYQRIKHALSSMRSI